MASLLNGRYELGDVLGSGGMGQVWRATDTRLARPVAIKILRGAEGADQDATARARFRSEARLAGSLHHPGIAQIYDVGEDESAPGRDPFIVMQLIDGTTLSQVLRERRTLPTAEVASIIGQVADALDTAHAAGIVHRDLKPSNIIITAAGRAVLVDFGIAWSATSEPLTATGSIIGTAEYFSPEQATGRPATARSDLYSLGVVAHHCIAGESPFRRDTPVATAMAQLHDPLPPLGDDVPVALRTLITALTEKDPDDRPSSAAAVSSLATADHPATAVLTTPPPATAVLATPATSATTIIPATTPARPTARRAAVGVAAAVVLIAALLGVRAIGGGSPDAPAADTTPTGGATTGTPDSEQAATDAAPTVTVAADALVGLSFADATAALSQRGLVAARKDVTSSAPAGTVTAVDPVGEVPAGSTVTLTVAAADAAAPGGQGKADKGNGKGKKKP